MTILLSGGGTGGHITPLLAVAHELKKIKPETKVVYVGERRGKFGHLTQGNADIDEVHTISAGKFRRYHDESWLRRATDVRTIMLNLRDAFLVALGFMQSFRLLGRLRPDAILLKGGYVGAPLGLAAALRRTPFVTHDSDAIAGLANRLVSRWARLHATGMPVEFYNYPPKTSAYVGVLVSSAYQPVTPELKQRYRRELGLPDGLVLLVTGGSLGAKRLNTALKDITPQLLAEYKDLTIIHQVGKGNKNLYGSFQHDRLIVHEFLEGMERFSGSADLIVTRAGANTLAEFGVQGKACIVVPNPQLPGGHQLVNARYLAEANAVAVVDEADFKKDTGTLQQKIQKLLNEPDKRQAMAAKLQFITKPDAAHQLAELLIEVGEA